MNLWGITLGAAQLAAALLTLIAGFIFYVAAKVVGHLVSEEVEGRIDQFGCGLVRLACNLRLPATIRQEYYQWWQADLVGHFQREQERPLTRLYWAVRFPVPLLFTARRTARILSPEAFPARRYRFRFRRKTGIDRTFLVGTVAGALHICSGFILVPGAFLVWSGEYLRILGVVAGVVLIVLGAVRFRTALLAHREWERPTNPN